MLRAILMTSSRTPGRRAPRGIVIRRATERDLPQLGALGALLMRTHYAFDRNRFMSPAADAAAGYSGFLQTQFNDPRVAIFVATRGTDLVGYVYAGFEPASWKELREEAGFIHDIVVAEQMRRAGIARRLMKVAIEWFRQRGARRVMLWTAEPNRSAQRLFAGLGFRQTMREMTRELKKRSGDRK